MLSRALIPASSRVAAALAPGRTAVAASAVQFAQRAVKMAPLPGSTSDAFLCSPCASLLAVANGPQAASHMHELHRGADAGSLVQRPAAGSMLVAALGSANRAQYVGLCAVGHCGVIVVRRDGRIAFSSRSAAKQPEYNCLEVRDGDVVALLSHGDADNRDLEPALSHLVRASCGGVGGSVAVEDMAEDLLLSCYPAHDNTVVLARLGPLGPCASVQPPATL